jgi:hypothetical protein
MAQMPPGRLGPARLILDSMRAAITGTVTLGEGPLPMNDPREIYPTWRAPDGEYDTIADNWRYSPFPGFPYTLRASELRGDRLVLNFAPWEVVTPECAGCDLRRLDLLVRGDTLEGEMSRPAGNGLGAVPSIRLQRIR